MTTVTDRLPARVLSPLFLVVAIDAIGMGVILPLLPFYSQHFGATPLVIGALVAAFSLGQFVAAPVLGKLSDRFGRKAVLLGSQIGTLASLVLLASAGNLLMVFLARILDGITSGNISVASAYAIDHSTPQNRRRAIGLVSAAFGVGMMVGPSLAAGLSHLSMSAPIWGASVLSLLSVVINLTFLPNGARASRRGEKRKMPSMRQALQSPGVPCVLIVLGLFYFGFSMYVSQFALYLQAHYRWNGVAFGPREVGYIFTASGVINILVQTAAMKRLERVIPDKLLAAVSLMMFSVGLSIFNLLPGLAPLAIGLFLASIGTAMSRPTLMAALSMASSPEQQGALMGVNTSLMAICNVIAPLFAGGMIEHRLFFGWALTIAVVMAIGGSCTVAFVRLRRWPGTHLTAPPEAALQRGP